MGDNRITKDPEEERIGERMYLIGLLVMGEVESYTDEDGHHLVLSVSERKDSWNWK
jgi:hypothetical protein